MADPGYYGNVWLECNFDGTDGDTTYQPSISYHVGGGVYASPSFTNGAHIENDVTLFSNAVCELDGIDDVLLFGTGGYLAFLCDHSISYALEVWVYFDVLSGDQIFLSNGYAPSSEYHSGFSIGADSSGNMIGGITDTDGTLESFAATSAFTAETWHYIKISFNSVTGVKIRVDGDVVVNEAIGGTPGTQYPGSLYFGRYRSTEGNMNGRIGPTRITKNETIDDGDVPTDVFAFPGWPTFEGDILLPSPLESGTTQMVGEQDFSAATVGLPANYLMELSGTTAYRIPISSWQATIQSGRANYLQCVIPNAGDYVAEITARQDTETFNIYSLVDLDGNDMRALISSSLIDYLTLDQGPTNYTCTLSGYPTAYVPGTPKTKTLSNVRTKSTDTNGNMRVRCDIDWYLRPGDTAYAGADEMTVTYINYYVNNTQAYMDVGER